MKEYEKKLKSMGYVFKQIIDYPNYIITSCGRVYSIRRDKFLKPFLVGKGYYNAGISNKYGYKEIRVHRLVAIHFIDNTDKKPEVNHIDGVKTNNHVSNLEWCTGSENIKHAFEKGLIVKSEKQKNSIRNIAKSQYGANHYISKKVIDTSTSIEYASIRDASKAIGVKYGTLRAQLIGRNKNKTTLKFI